MKINSPKLASYLLNDGIIQDARMDLKIDKEALAKTIQQTVEAALSKAGLFGVEVHKMNQKESDNAVELKNNAEIPFKGTIDIHTDRLVDQLESFIQLLLKNHQATETKLEYFAKIIPHDDGGKYTLSISKSSFQAMLEGRSIEVEGIIDRSDIPNNKAQMVGKSQEIVGMDPETGKITLDGQNLLKALQAFTMGKHRLNDEETLIEKDLEQLKMLSQFIPALQATVQDDDIIIELDMAKLRAGIRAFLEKDLHKIKGVTIAPINDENPATVSVQIDYKTLADQTMSVVADQLMPINGVRVNDDQKATNIMFSTDLRNQECLVDTLHAQIGNVVKTLGKQIVGELEDKTPPSLITSVKKHFLKPVDAPQTEVG